MIPLRILLGTSDPHKDDRDKKIPTNKNYIKECGRYASELYCGNGY